MYVWEQNIPRRKELELAEEDLGWTLNYLIDGRNIPDENIRNREIKKYEAAKKEVFSMLENLEK